ncbi:ribosomal protection-like ABC-F family protein [Paenibacillus macquariensis]|uniref:ATPase components of ABC transporters with duplicated ATPase domains n=1 Tax=Paenibacillus macquariensis TaxID=948756 RepID=A0ABY1K1Q4_9BACL|nr:ABC-F type ribosomal protection protein [Paenibacillus macquariensis]MEC0091709.1 ABC-F type ribosomal protection protein [Paenibacillus macquariensis]OAB32365.1 ABC transporter ATP-binding protein [Paenibacillus macquariensis subsp. macquariensis]SIR13598.1 ATPase components of ABC transporters with duplicated ATPase domains [Paenibacillus macquariensis]
MMIQCKNVQKYHGAQLVLNNITMDIRAGEKVGLIGRNGCGKTTLLHLLREHDRPDQGHISIRKGARIGFLDQIPVETVDSTTYEQLLLSFAEPLKWQARMNELEQSLSDPQRAHHEKIYEEWLQEYGRLQEQFEQAGGYEMEASIDRIANGLGITPDQYHRTFSSLSGGEKTKVGLASLLLKQPDILLLDEPTNHLDMSAIEWLEQFITDYPGSVIAISHDRYFLDRIVTKVIEIEDGEAFTYHTNYSGYMKEKETRLLLQFADYQEQQKQIKKMQESIKQLIEWGNRSNPPNPGFHRRAASMQKALDRMQKLKRPILERKSMDLQLSQEDRSGKQVLVMKELSKSYDSRTLFEHVHEVLHYGESAMLLGDNGSGKSTLLKIILGMETPSGGEVTLGSRVSIGYLAQEETPQNWKQNILQYFREQVGMEEGEARGELARFLFYGPDVFKDVRSLSGGEWTRLRFAILMYQKPNLLILDEPTNHLDIDSREALEDALEEFPGTLLAVSHDRYFINRMGRKIWVLKQGALDVIHGNFDDYKAIQARQVVNSSEQLSNHVNPDIRSSKAKQTPDTFVTKTSRTKRNASIKSSHASLELQIAELERQIELLDIQMLSPDICRDATQLFSLQQEREDIQKQLDSLFEQWMETMQINN